MGRADYKTVLRLTCRRSESPRGGARGTSMVFRSPPMFHRWHSRLSLLLKDRQPSPTLGSKRPSGVSRLVCDTWSVPVTVTWATATSRQLRVWAHLVSWTGVPEEWRGLPRAGRFGLEKACSSELVCGLVERPLEAGSCGFRRDCWESEDGEPFLASVGDDLVASQRAEAYVLVVWCEGGSQQCVKVLVVTIGSMLVLAVLHTASSACDWRVLQKLCTSVWRDGRHKFLAVWLMGHTGATAWRAWARPAKEHHECVHDCCLQSRTCRHVFQRACSEVASAQSTAPVRGATFP